MAMPLRDPIAAYNAETNVDAMLVQRFLEDRGVEAFAVEDNSLVGYWMLGTLPEIHKPQVWVNRDDKERAAQLLLEYENLKKLRDPDRTTHEPKSISVHCEHCGKDSQFSESLNKTVQDCPHCGSFVDVGDSGWEFDEDEIISDQDEDPESRE